MAMSGSITEMSLVDLIQLACMERYTARLTVVHEGETARVYFATGEIVHAEVGDRSGSEALYEAVGWTQGDFTLDRGVETEVKTIQGSWTAHLLEALVRMDHSAKDSFMSDPEEDTDVRFSMTEGPEESTDSRVEATMTTNSQPEGADWKQSLEALEGVRQLVLVRTDGLPHEEAARDQDEQAAALTAFIGNAAKGIGKTLNLGDLDRAEVRVNGVPRVVLSCSDCYAGLEVSRDLNPHHVALEARRILREGLS